MSRPLRIAHLAFSAPPLAVGGLEIVVDTLIRRQRALGHEAELVTRWRHARAARDGPYPVFALPPNPRPPGAGQSWVGPRWPVAAAVAARQLLGRYDLWHAHWVYPTGWMAAPALGALGVPLIMTAHGLDVEVDAEEGHGLRLDPVHDRRIRGMIPQARWLTAISPSVEARFAEMGADPQAVTAIPNGVAMSRFDRPAARAETRRRFGLPEDAPLILTVGADRAAKGHRFIPPALARLWAAGVPAHWAVLGGDRTAMAERSRAIPVEAARALHVIPPLRPGQGEEWPSGAVIDLLRAADLFAMPSVSEGFGMAALEAMAAGLPVVASDVSGLAALIRDGETGRLVPPADPAALAEALRALIAAPERAAALGRAARAAAADYDWDRVTERYLALYRQATETA